MIVYIYFCPWRWIPALFNEQNQILISYFWYTLFIFNLLGGNTIQCLPCILHTFQKKILKNQTENAQNEGSTFYDHFYNNWICYLQAPLTFVSWFRFYHGSQSPNFKMLTFSQIWPPWNLPKWDTFQF